MHVRRSVVMQVVVACVALGLSGCAAGAGTSTLASAGGSPLGSVRRAVPQASVVWATRVETLDPVLAVEPQDVAIVHLVGGTLFRYTPSGTGGMFGLGVEPALATGGFFSDHSLAFTATLRRGLRFANGAPLTVKDVVATFLRAQQDKSNIYAGFFTSIKTMTTRGSSITFHLSAPYRALPAYLAATFMTILPRGQFGTVPTSAGPYEISRFSSGSDTAVMVPNPHYAGPRPAVNRLSFVTVPDANSEASQLEDGQFGAVWGLPPALATRMPSSVVVSAPQLYGDTQLLLNDRTPGLSDVRVRQAISLALNRQKITQVAFDGLAKPLFGYFPPVQIGYENVLPTKPDLAKARALLKGTRCAHGCSFQIVVNASTGSYYGPAAEVIQQELAPLGITTHVDVLDDVTVTNAMEKPSSPYQMSVTYNYDYVSAPDGMLIYCALSTGGLNACYSFQPDRQMDADVLGVTQAPSTAARTRALKTFNAYFAKALPWIPIATFPAVFAERRDLAGILAVNHAGFVDVASLS